MGAQDHLVQHRQIGVAAVTDHGGDFVVIVREEQRLFLPEFGDVLTPIGVIACDDVDLEAEIGRPMLNSAPCESCQRSIRPSSFQVPFDDPKVDQHEATIAGFEIACTRLALGSPIWMVQSLSRPIVQGSASSRS